MNPNQTKMRISQTVIAADKATRDKAGALVNESQLNEFDRAMGTINDGAWAIGKLRANLGGKTINDLVELRDALKDLIEGGMDLRNELNAIIAQDHVANIRRMRENAGEDRTATSHA